MSLAQLMYLCGTVLDHYKAIGLNDDQMNDVRVAIEDPRPDGVVAFHLGVPHGIAPKLNFGSRKK